MVATRKGGVVNLHEIPYDEFWKNLIYDIFRWLGENKKHVILKRRNRDAKRIKEQLYAILEVKNKKREEIVGVEVRYFEYIIKFLPEAFNKFLVDKKYDKYGISYILEKLDNIGVVVKDDKNNFLTEFKLPHSSEIVKGYVLNFICSIPTYFFWRSDNY